MGNENMQEYEDNLRDLPSFGIYQELNKEEVSTSNDNYCNILVTEKDDVKKLCKKVARNLIKLKDVKLMKNEIHGNRCLFFNFWTHE
ncbi:PIR Superfamily Protein [Plasmodium ovale wallikeri]|uniref:PIR Superfamily Protein n=1 Tax=Plasmodium ovale wallikeri TaxID=864142 RepID=A0A1A8YYV9_PLAOA|nr:PIR Superfamily Protein [Plasmodium ovale wallikeri]SBT37226.1 PIR Superfamily Protein [Plasmodium ovale wallikeri]